VVVQACDLYKSTSMVSTWISLMKQVIHESCVIASLSRKLRIWLWKVIGKELMAYPSITLRKHSGISSLVQISMVSTSTVLQKICIS
jgi:hypothetical protein